MTFYFDNNISYKFARMLAALDVEALHVAELEIGRDATDLEIFQFLKGKDAIFLTADRSISTRKIEAAAMREADIVTLFLGPFWSKMWFWDQAVWLIQRWPMIEGFARGAAQRTAAEIKRNGRSQVFPT